MTDDKTPRPFFDQLFILSDTLSLAYIYMNRNIFIWILYLNELIWMLHTYMNLREFVRQCTAVMRQCERCERQYVAMRQCARQCIEVYAMFLLDSAWQCARHCAANRQCGSVRQCAAVCSSIQQWAAVCGSARGCVRQSVAVCGSAHGSVWQCALRVYTQSRSQFTLVCLYRGSGNQPHVPRILIQSTTHQYELSIRV
jgi:hypothetical protein